VSRITKDNESAALARRLDALICILLNPIRIQEGTLREKTVLLISFGFDNQEISRILKTTPGVVANERSLLKRSESR